MPADAIIFSKAVRTKRGTISSTTEALRFMDRELPAELMAQSRWTFARALLLEAETTGKKRDIVCAVRQLRQALSNDMLLSEPPDHPEHRGS